MDPKTAQTKDEKCACESQENDGGGCCGGGCGDGGSCAHADEKLDEVLENESGCCGANGGCCGGGNC